MMDLQAARWTDRRRGAGARRATITRRCVPMGCFATADGYVNIAGPSGRLLRNFCEADRPARAARPTRASTRPPSAIGNRAALNALDRRTAAHADHGREWVEDAEPRPACRAGRSTGWTRCSPTRRCEHLAMTEPVEHPALGRLDILRNAVRMTGAVSHGPDAPSPTRGDHTGEVLAELGYPQAEIDRLRARV